MGTDKGMNKSKVNKAVRAKKKAVAVSEVYRTRKGRMLVGRIEDALESAALKAVRGKANLIFTSPPFPLVRKKRYGNETGGQYLRWLEGFGSWTNPESTPFSEPLFGII